MERVIELTMNSTFWAGIFAWIIAQVAKLVSNGIRTRRLNLHYLVSLGGMPSSHSAAVCALATAIGWSEGFDSPMFGLSMGLAIITMFDASTVRRAAGQQARLLNEMITEFFNEHRFSEAKLVELLGHTRFEVFVGAVMGVVVGMLVKSVYAIFLPATEGLSFL